MGRLDLERVHEAEPPLPRLLHGSPGGGDILVPGDDRPCLIPIVGLPQDHDHRVLAPGRDGQRGEESSDRPIVDGPPGVGSPDSTIRGERVRSGSEEMASSGLHEFGLFGHARESGPRTERVAGILEEERGERNSRRP